MLLAPGGFPFARKLLVPVDLFLYGRNCEDIIREGEVFFLGCRSVKEKVFCVCDGVP